MGQRVYVTTAAAAMLLLLAAVAQAEVDTDRVAQGGRLYDKWWVEMGLKAPTTTHSAYPQSGKQSGADTWRCKECHGWDYRGRDGAYSSGGHYTGITGIQGQAGGNVDRVFAILKNQTHHYDDVMLDAALLSLALFVVEGQVEMGKYIDAKTKQVQGDVRRGKALFTDQCARCHDSDGRAMNFAGSGEPEYIGTVASDNPWEALHKVRNGHPGAYMRRHGGMGMMGGKWRPGEAMPAMLAELSLQEQVDLLSYIKTLPRQ